MLLAAAAVFGFVEATLAVKARSREQAWGRAVLPVAAATGLAAAIAFSQDIPDVLPPHLPIPNTDTDRHGRPRQLFWTWTSPNMEFATIFVGVLAVQVFGLTFGQAVAAILLGTRFGWPKTSTPISPTCAATRSN